MKYRCIALVVALLPFLLFSPMAQAQRSKSVSPPPVAAPPQQDMDPNSMVIAALQAAQLVDANRTAEVWDGSSVVAKRIVSRDAFVRQVAGARASLGQPLQRNWISVTRQQIEQTIDPNAPPPGLYISVRFLTRFANGQALVELVTFQLEADGIWRVAGYSVQ